MISMPAGTASGSAVKVTDASGSEGDETFTLISPSVPFDAIMAMSLPEKRRRDVHLYGS